MVWLISMKPIPLIRPLIAALMCGIFFFDIYIPQGVAANLPYIFVLFLSYWTFSPPFIMRLTALALILSSMGFLFSPPSENLWKGILNRILSILVMIATAALLTRIMNSEKDRQQALEERERALKDREQALTEVKILQGLLPTCSGCKKIRDEAGNWTQIESYIRKHSEAEFSHGICPDCLKRLYPEFSGDGQRPSS